MAIFLTSGHTARAPVLRKVETNPDLLDIRQDFIVEQTTSSLSSRPPIEGFFTKVQAKDLYFQIKQTIS